MRKILTSLLLLLIFTSLIFADTATASMDVEAYKEAPVPETDYTITVKNYNAATISGITGNYDITNNMATSRTLSDSFYITVSSNLKTNITIGLDFTPFVNQDKKTTTMPVTYSFSSSTATAVTGSQYTSYTENSGPPSRASSMSNGNNNNQQEKPKTYTFYRYTPSFMIDNDVTATIDVTSTTSKSLVFNPTYKIEYGTSDRSSGYSSIRDWTTTDTLPTTSDSTLPGFVSSQTVSATAYFDLSIAESDYTAMETNVDYVATVTLTISST